MADTNIAAHWAKQDIYALIMNAAKTANISPDELTQKTLATMDHVHTGGLASTVELGDKLPAERDHILLDIGCGLGGPARYFSERFGCRVQGVDLTPQFVECAVKLTELLGLSNRIAFTEGNALELPFDPSSFDGAYSQHVTMNIEDRERFFSEAFRVLKPGGYFALSEHGLGNAGTLQFPLPWSEDGSGSYLIEPKQTTAYLENAGFRDIEVEETGPKYLAFYRQVQARAREGKLPPIGMHLLMGQSAPDPGYSSKTGVILSAKGCVRQASASDNRERTMGQEFLHWYQNPEWWSAIGTMFAAGVALFIATYSEVARRARENIETGERRKCLAAALLMDVGQTSNSVEHLIRLVDQRAKSSQPSFQAANKVILRLPELTHLFGAVAQFYVLGRQASTDVLALAAEIRTWNHEIDQPTELSSDAARLRISHIASLIESSRRPLETLAGSVVSG